ncbi:hypothetical protein PoB_003374300 [Plakobranchus ocellatus]|uniref:Uncharacterized protein n=1 Tax=Plakobranchus ocellatus TaxID=259542 RepID=A0AAV4AJ20_9GAST|nr:hypothetical protein PoB_003374300 [Plakobranchus ocellatus]
MGGSCRESMGQAVPLEDYLQKNRGGEDQGSCRKSMVQAVLLADYVRKNRGDEDRGPVASVACRGHQRDRLANQGRTQPQPQNNQHCQTLGCLYTKEPLSNDEQLPKYYEA